MKRIWRIGNITFMDRIYTTKDTEVGEFIKYAKDKGWYYKKYQKASYYDDNDDKYYTVISNEGKEIFLDLDLTLSNNYIYFPYMDSFNYYEREANTIYFSKCMKTIYVILKEINIYKKEKLNECILYKW